MFLQFIARATFDQVKASLDRLSEEHANYVRKSLTLLTLQDRHSSILKLCLDQGGFAFEHYFEDVANRFRNASDDPETFKAVKVWRKSPKRQCLRVWGAVERPPKIAPRDTIFCRPFTGTRTIVGKMFMASKFRGM